MIREPSSSPNPGRPGMLFVVLVVILVAIWWLLNSASRIEEFALPEYRGRLVLDRLFGFLFGSFCVYTGFSVLKPDVARYWAERAAAQHEFWARITNNSARRASAEEHLPTWRVAAMFFALMSFVIGALVLGHEAITLFVG